MPCRRESNLLVGLKGSLHVGVHGHKADSADGPEDRGKLDSGSKTDKFRTLADFERLSFESGHSRPGLSLATPFLVYMARILVVEEGGQSSAEGWRPHRKVQT